MSLLASKQWRHSAAQFGGESAELACRLPLEDLFYQVMRGEAFWEKIHRETRNPPAGAALFMEQPCAVAIIIMVRSDFTHRICLNLKEPV